MIWKGLECMNGPMEGDMKESTFKIRSKDTDSTCGQMADPTKAIGTKANSMA